MIPRVFCCLVLLAHIAVGAPWSTNGNRLAYLNGSAPFHPGLKFPKLITPQWVGEEGVEAVIILSIDDMRGNEPKYEAMLRPILDRLKKIDGRAPASIMVNTFAETNTAQLQSWLKEGVSLDCHTIGHPCPLCQNKDFTAASRTYHDCVDLLSRIPGNKPVAFRMPCCDSMNSPTPRFYSEIFNRVSAQRNFLTIDSSVMVMLTTNDQSLPRRLLMDEEGRERFRKYLPTQTNAVTRVSMGSFTTTIEDYPYPYVIGDLCWEFPCIVPSDWEANNLHRPNNPDTVRDWKRALDAVVLKQGLMTIVFHPHGWITSEQMVEFVDYAAATYGRRIKFLSFREAAERLDEHLLNGRSLRTGSGADNGIRIADLNNDGFMDVMVGGTSRRVTRVWQPETKSWVEGSFPIALAGSSADQFGVLGPGVAPTLFVANHSGDAARIGAWQFSGGNWSSLPDAAIKPIAAIPRSSFVLHDVDQDGVSELIVSSPNSSAVYRHDSTNFWRKLDFELPSNTRLFDDELQDAGFRFVDVDGDGFDDIIFSDHERYSLHLYRKDDRKLRLKPGWTDEIVSGERRDPLTDPIPPIVRAGTNRNNGVWFARSTMWIQNEDTAHLPDKVDRRTFKQLLSGFLPQPLPPAEAIKSMKVRPGFTVELVAAEPMVTDPISLDWDADGRLWVTEMGDYPSGIDETGTPGGRIRILEDTDRDGRYDKSTTFLEGLNFPTGLHPWRKGVVISAAPDVFYAEDTDGDGRADLREVLFTGFTEGNQQHRVNGFDFGLDGWLYAANGDSGGNVRALGAGHDEPPVSIRGRDLRVQPDKRLMEPIAGQTQYGRRRDDWDNWFGNNNPTWLWHFHFPDHYLARNPYLAVKALKKVLANYPDSTRCFPISRMMSRFNDPFAANHVTSAGGSAPYRDELFGLEFESAVFITEAVHNLVHCEILKPDGVTFSSHRASGETKMDFLASTDNWFRPVFARMGPDGALYIADMYRLVIEHPEWIPIEMQRRLDLRAGADKGRIYRVYPSGAKLRPMPRMSQFTSSDLVECLTSPNGLHRDAAQRLLLERQDHSVAEGIEQVASGATSPKSRMQALWTLRGLGMLRVPVLAAALRDSDPRVREHAVRLTEPMIADLLPQILALATDQNARVRFQVAFTLGVTTNTLAADALAKLARDPDENIRNAALSSVTPHVQALLAHESQRNDERSKPILAMLQKLAKHPQATQQAKMIERTNVLSAEHRAERAAVISRYAEATRITPDIASGRTLFEQNCAQCHRHRGLGAEVGPDLGIMTGKSVEQVIIAVLDPNAAVEDRFRSYSVMTRDDRDLTGVIAAETPTSITLRAPNQADELVLRSEITEFVGSGLSLMPDGFEAAFTPQQLADLIAFVLGR